jgi:hypothetical protein
MRFALALPLLAALQAHAAAENGDVLLQQTLAVSLGGQEVGTIDALDKKTADGIELVRITKLRVQRGATTNDIDEKTVVELTADGAPKGYTYARTDASGTLTSTGVIKNGMLELTTTQNGSTTKNELEVKPGTTFSIAVEADTREHLRDGWTFDKPVIIEEMGAPVDLHVDVKKKGESFIVSSSFLKLKTDEEMDAKGRTIVSRTPSMGIVAYPPGNAPADLLKGTSDLLALSTWRTKEVLPPVSKVVYKVTAPDAKNFDIPEDARQKIKSRDDKAIVVEVKAGDTFTGKISDVQRKRWLSETPYEEVNDPRIQKTANDAAGGATSKKDEVAKLVHFVYAYVSQKGLDRGYAPAVATLESKTGDCTEHSVLLSALLRARGIPTRLVDGVIIDGTHAGYHEWVEAYLDGEGFVPADPTFNQFPAGPERLKLAEGSTLPDEHLQLSLAAARLLKPGVKIEVLEAAK